MQPIDGLTRRRGSRYVWVLLALVFAGLMFGARFGQERALKSEQDDVRALAGLVLDTLVPADVDGPVSGPAEQAITATFQDQVFSNDATVSAAFIWKADGTLIWSSDRVGEPIARRAADEDLLARASGGRAATLRTTSPALFKTYVPLRIAGRLASLGAVEIDRPGGTDLWRPLQVGFFILTVFSLVLCALSLRRPLEAAEPERRGSSSKRSGGPGRSPAEAELRRIRDSLLEERELRRQAEETYGFLERKLREVETSQASLQSRANPEQAAAAEKTLRAAEERAAKAEARAAEAEARAADAEKRATIAESRYTDAAARTEELEHRAARAEARASEDEVEIGRLRDAESQTTEELGRLRDSESENTAQIERLRHDLEEARERTRQGVETYAFLESRLRKAEERFAAASAQGAGAESKLAEFEKALHAAEGRAAQAETELGRLREAEAEAEKLRREILAEKESGRGGLDQQELTLLNDRMEAAERRAVEADRRLRELAKLARAAEVSVAPQRHEPSPAAPATPEAGRTAPGAAKPEFGRPSPRPSAPAPAKPEPAKPEEEDVLETPESDLPRHARNLRDRLTRTANLKKLGHKDGDEDET
jgi:hypothetical protein